MSQATRLHNKRTLNGMAGLLRGVSQTLKADAQFIHCDAPVQSSLLLRIAPVCITIDGIAGVIEGLVNDDRIWKQRFGALDVNDRLVEELQRIQDQLAALRQEGDVGTEDL